MKKSNIFLISAFGVAFIWTVLIGLFAASAINSDLQGKESSFARSHTRYLDVHKKTFATPKNELLISGDGKISFTILPGKEFTVLSNPKEWNCEYTDLKNGQSLMRFKLLNHEYDDKVVITLPVISIVSIDNCSQVMIDNLNQKAISYNCKRVVSFTAVRCKTGALNLDFPGKNDVNQITIDKTNVIDTLIASVQGFGNIRIETTGIHNNQLSLSNSIRIDATSDILKKLALK